MDGWDVLRRRRPWACYEEPELLRDARGRQGRPSILGKSEPLLVTTLINRRRRPLIANRSSTSRCCEEAPWNSKYDRGRSAPPFQRLDARGPLGRARAAPALPAAHGSARRLVEWSVPWPDYTPIEFVTEKVLSESPDRKPKGWADRDEPPEAAVLKKRGSHELQALAKPWAFDAATNRPMNPRGRTGITNRGTLGKWGPNHAGDAIVTRYNLSLPHQPLEFVAIKRRETGHWAIPGGMVDPGEIAMATLRREFREEAANLPQSEQMRITALLDEIFAPENGRVIYRGSHNAHQAVLSALNATDRCVRCVCYRSSIEAMYLLPSGLTHTRTHRMPASGHTHAHRMPAPPSSMCAPQNATDCCVLRVAAGRRPAQHGQCLDGDSSHAFPCAQPASGGAAAEGG